MGDPAARVPGVRGVEQLPGVPGVPCGLIMGTALGTLWMAGAVVAAVVVAVGAIRARSTFDTKED